MESHSRFLYLALPLSMLFQLTVTATEENGSNHLTTNLMLQITKKNTAFSMTMHILLPPVYIRTVLE